LKPADSEQFAAVRSGVLSIAVFPNPKIYLQPHPPSPVKKTGLPARLTGKTVDKAAAFP